MGSIATIKYLHKYFNKGPDFINIYQANKSSVRQDNEQQTNQDEIANHLECGAMWRILEYPLHGRSHSVLTLPVHLPKDRHIVFQEDDNFEEIDNRLERHTKL